MSRVNRMIGPSQEIVNKIHQAQKAIALQKMRALKCPYCGRSTIIVFEDTRGHIQTKCKSCRQETVFHVSGTAQLLS